MSAWFRFYDDAMDDAKLLSISDKDLRLWLRLLCLASKHDGNLPSMPTLSKLLRVRLDYVQGGVERLLKVGLIDELAISLDEYYTPHNWSKRQYKSDSSAERVAKHREKCNVTVTPRARQIQITDTDTEKRTLTSSKKNDEIEVLEVKEKSAPADKRGSRLTDDWQPSDDMRKVAFELGFGDAALGVVVLEFKNYWTGKAGKEAVKLDWQKTFHNWMLRKNEFKQASPAAKQSVFQPAPATLPETIQIEPSTPEWDAAKGYFKLFDHARLGRMRDIEAGFLNEAFLVNENAFRYIQGKARQVQGAVT